MAQLSLSADGSGSVLFDVDGNQIELSSEVTGQIAGLLLAASFGGNVDFTTSVETPHLVAVPTPRPPISPVPAPRPAPQPAAAVVWSSEQPDADGALPTFTARSREQMLTSGITESQVHAVIQDPDAVLPAKFGDVDSYHGDGLSILVSRGQDRRIIGVSEYDGHVPSQGRAPSGGAGRKMPSSGRELLKMFAKAGFQISKRGSDHYRAVHPDRPGEPITLPASPSDHMSYINVILEARRRTGIDVSDASGGACE